jgi:TonB family protein
MLDQLIESRNTSVPGTTQRNSLLLGVFLIMALAVGSAVGYSLYQGFKSLLSNGLGGDLELTELVAPIPVQAEEPEPPPEEKPKEVTKVEQNVDVRKVIIQNMMETPKVPEKIEVTKQETPPRRLDVKTIQGSTNSTADRPISSDSNERVVQQTQGIGDKTGTTLSSGDGDSDEPKIVKPTPVPTAKPTEKPVPKVVSGGVVNSKATNLVKPPYPPAARAVRASGAVNVQVTISESGSVISASAVSGHPLLRQAAEQAARQSKFSPTTLSGQAVKVTGVIVYNFVP